jgi:hypothetical protein
VKKYRVTIESNFVHLPDDASQLYGYFTTLEVKGYDPKDAFQDLVPQLIRCIDSRNIRFRSEGLFQTNYMLNNAWGVEENNDSAPDFVGGTFVFYRITKFNALLSLARRMFVRVTKPYVIFFLPTP